MSITIKVCGLTRASDARGCLELGADYLGMIFAPSPRRVTLDQAREIRRAVPHARLVGVFVDAPPEEILAIAREVGLDLLQLHGAETPEICRRLHAASGLPVIKALTLAADGAPRGSGAQGEGRAEAGAVDLRRAGAYATATELLLLDLAKGIAAEQVPAARARLWAAAADLAAAGGKVLLAGALTPQNVCAAIERARPFGVDVSRGVEQAPGIKDREQVEQFMKEAKACPRMSP